MLYYDHLITFPTEFEKIWKRKLSFINAIFLVNRYVTFLGYIALMIFTFSPPNNLSVSLLQIVSTLLSELTVSQVVGLQSYHVKLPLNKSLSRCKKITRLGGSLSLLTQIIIASKIL